MDLLLELVCEEIPARMQPRALENLKTIIKDDLIESNLTFGNVRGHVTPRRLAISVEGLRHSVETIIAHFDRAPVGSSFELNTVYQDVLNKIKSGTPASEAIADFPLIEVVFLDESQTTRQIDD